MDIPISGIFCAMISRAIAFSSTFTFETIFPGENDGKGVDQTMQRTWIQAANCCAPVPIQGLFSYPHHQFH
jgi:hypothetical protein